MSFYLGDLLADLEKPHTDVTAVVAVKESMFQVTVTAFIHFIDCAGGTSDVW